MAAVVTRKAQSAGGPDGSAEVGPGRAMAGSEPWIGFKNLMKRVPIVRSVDVLSGGDRQNGKEKKMGVADDRMKSAAVLVESREESGLEEQSADVGELHDSRSLHCVASTDISNLPTAEGGRPSLPTVAETSAVSSEDTLQEMRQQLKELEKMWKASVNSQMAGFQRRNNELTPEVTPQEEGRRKCGSIIQRYVYLRRQSGCRATTCRVQQQGALQNSGQRRSVTMDNGSDNTSLDSRSVNVDKHDDLQYVWYEGALQNSGQRRSVAMDNGSDNTSLDSRSVNVDKHDDLQYVWYEGALQNSGQRRSVAMDNGSDNTSLDSRSVNVDKHDDLQYVWYEGALQNSGQRRSVAMDNGSDNTSLDSRSVNVDKHDDLQYVWYEGALQNSGQRRSVAMDNGSDNTSLDSRSVNVDKHDDLQYVWYEGALQNSGQRRSVAMDNGSDNTSLDSRSVDVDRHDDLQYVWYEGAMQNSGQRRSVAMDNGSDNTSLDSRSVDVDRHDDLQYLTDMGDQHEESTVQENTAPTLKKKNRVQKLKRWFQRKGRKFVNKIRRR
uniref:Uncharacterized protein n=1 Tax=Branchiostoma floridae TaxID=7739 RepID=C3ZEI1_BRAFL|eukprot:XP_002593126.1 hypothetical protein BRAFLDRAFT_120168 [Branchiostoma floridae]